MQFGQATRGLCGAFVGAVIVTGPSLVGIETVPVPAALPLLATALAGFGIAAWRKRKAA